MNSLSCDPGLYRSGGLYQDASVLGTGPDGPPPPGCITVAQLYAPFTYKRPDLDLIIGCDVAFEARLRDLSTWMNGAVRAGAAAALVRLERGSVRGNVVYLDTPDGRTVLHETFRTCDQPYVRVAEQGDWDGERADLSDPGVQDLFVGSAGTENYGHWLVDDLPRALGARYLAAHGNGRPVRVWITDAGEAMNAVRAASVMALCRDVAGLEVRVLERERLYDFTALHYVTPVTLHPILKSPQAIAAVRTAFGAGPGRRRLFLTRPAGAGRGIGNEAAVQAMLERRGFVRMEPETLPFAEQAAALAEAEAVVGIMGAAMTNTLFMPPGFPVLHLAPEGWAEPFYWDLAAVCGHRYGVCFGPPEPGAALPHHASFRIDPALLETALGRLGM